MIGIVPWKTEELVPLTYNEVEMYPHFLLRNEGTTFPLTTRVQTLKGALEFTVYACECVATKCCCVLQQAIWSSEQQARFLGKSFNYPQTQLKFEEFYE